MKRMTNKEISELKISFIKSIMPNKTFKSKAEIKERLIMYRDLYAIKNENERMFVNQMIAIANTIPDELIKKKEQKHLEPLPEVKIKCSKCGKKLEDDKHQLIRIRQEFINENTTVLRDIRLEYGEYQCINSDCAEYYKIKVLG